MSGGMVHLDVNGRSINKNVPVPYYYQIAQTLREAIDDAGARLQEGEVLLPSETRLCKLFEVARATVRHALEMLEREGLIYREKGRGTFVRRPRLKIDVRHLASTTKDMQASGVVPGFRMLSVEAVRPGPNVRHALGLAKTSAVWEIRRLRMANGDPVGVQCCWIPVSRTPGLDEENLAVPVVPILEARYGIKYGGSHRIIRTRAATAEEARMLQIAEEAPVFAISGTDNDDHGVPLDYVQSVWRGDRYDLEVRLSTPD